MSRRSASKCCISSSMVYYSPPANAPSYTPSDGTQFGRTAARAVTHTLTHTISLGDEAEGGGAGDGRRPGEVRHRAKVRLGHVNARLRRRRSISQRTSAEKDPPRIYARGHLHARELQASWRSWLEHPTPPCNTPLNVNRCHTRIAGDRR